MNRQNIEQAILVCDRQIIVLETELKKPTRVRGVWTQVITETTRKRATQLAELKRRRERLSELASQSEAQSDKSPTVSNFLIRAQRKLDDPKKFPTMDAKEVMAVLGLKSSAVYDHPRLQRISTGTRRVLVTTKSVKAVLDSPPE